MTERLQITAHLRGPISLPAGPMALDALLMAAVCARDSIPPILDGDPMEIPIPVERERGIYLASFSVAAFETHALRYVNRRHPIEQEQTIGSPKTKRITLTTGPTKSYRIPTETGHVEHDRLDWYCIGEREAIADLLALVLYLGKKRSVGNGAVARWTAAPHEGWPGFPVVRDGKPLRPLPLDWPGLVEPETATRGMVPPYWHHSTRQLCAVPDAH